MSFHIDNTSLMHANIEQAIEQAEYAIVITIHGLQSFKKNNPVSSNHQF